MLHLYKYRFVLCIGLLFSYLPTSTHAQVLFKKGQKSFYGGFWINTTNQNGQKTLNFSLSPGMQVFLKKGLGVGGSVSLNGNVNANRKSGDFGKMEQLAYGFGPSVSYYLPQPILGKAYPFVHNGLQLHGYKDYQTQTRQPLRLSNTASVGALYMLTQHTGIQASYNYYSDNIGTKDRVTTSGFGTGLTVFF